MRYLKLGLMLTTYALAGHVLAANECNVQYQKVGSNSWISLSANKGQIKTVNVKNVAKINNIGPNKIVRTAADAKPPVLTLNNGQNEFFPSGTKFNNFNCTGNSGTTSTSTFINNLKSLGFDLPEISKQVATAFNKSGKDMIKILTDAGYQLPDVIATIKSQFNVGGEQMVLWLKSLNYTVTQILEPIRLKYNADATAVILWAIRANYVIRDIVKAGMEKFSATQSDMAKWLHDAGKNWNDIAKGLKDGANATAAQIASALKAAGASANEAALALKNVIVGVSNQLIAQALKSANYTLAEIGNMLKVTLNQSASSIGNILKNLGYSLVEVGKWLNGEPTILDDYSQCVACNNGERLMQLLKDTYNVGVNDMARAMRQMRINARQVAAGLRRIYNATNQQIQNALRTAGFTAAEIQAALAALGDAASTTLKNVNLISRMAVNGFDYSVPEQRIALGYGTNYLTFQSWPANAGGYKITIPGVASTAVSPQGFANLTIRAGTRTGNYNMILQYPAGTQAIPVTLYTRGTVARINSPYRAQNNGEFTVVYTGQNLGNAIYLPRPLNTTLPHVTVRVVNQTRTAQQVTVRLQAICPTTAVRRELTKLDFRYSDLVDRNFPRSLLARWKGSNGIQFPYFDPEASPSAGVNIREVEVTGCTIAQNATSGGTAGTGGTGGAGGNNTVSHPDLVPTLLGQTPLLRHESATSRKIDSSYCLYLPQARKATDPKIGEVTVGNITWGVRNASNEPVNSNFRIELKGGNNLTLQQVNVGGLASGATSRHTYVRPQSKTKVIWIGVSTNQTHKSYYGGEGCFQQIMGDNDPMNWQDPPFVVQVDSLNQVQESRETNNSRTY